MKLYHLFLVQVRKRLKYILFYVYINVGKIVGKKLPSETSGNSRSASPTSNDNGVMQFTPTGLYFLPESVKLLSPSMVESQSHGTNH